MTVWLGRLLWVLRAAIAVALFHYPAVLFGFLHPRTYIRSLRIKRTIEGRPLVPGGLFAIYAIRIEGKGCPFWILDMLDGLRSAEINVCVVSNSELDEEQVAFLRAYAYRLIVRDGSGRDFGSYKDAIIELFSRTDIRRILLINDSFYSIPCRLPRMLSELMDDSDSVIATNESTERQYHLQSFAISIPSTVFNYEPFRSYWRSYLPISARQYVIRKGEIKFSKVLLLLNARIKIIYSVENLETFIGNLRSVCWCDPRAMPIHRRDLIPARIMFRPKLPLELGTAICGAIARGSQVHNGSFFFLAYLESAILKRDIVFRHQFTLSECSALIKAVGNLDRADEIIQDLRRRGDRSSLNVIQRLKYDYGLI